MTKERLDSMLMMWFHKNPGYGDWWKGAIARLLLKRIEKYNLEITTYEQLDDEVQTTICIMEDMAT